MSWEPLLREALYHGIAPLLYVHLKGLGSESVPAEVIRTLQGLINSLAFRSLHIVGETGRLARLLDAEGISFIVIKGAPLALTVYGSLALRPFVDIDLLTRKADFDRLERALVEDGYLRRKASRLSRHLYLLVHGQYSFKGPDEPGALKAAVDVHTRALPFGYSYSEGLEALLERAQRETLGGAAVRVPCPEDHLLLLCFHGFKNRWDRLKHVCDVAEVVRAHGDLDWDLLSRSAEASHGTRVLHLGLSLAHELVDAPVEPWVLQAARRTPSVRSLAEEVIERLPVQPYMAVEPYWKRVRLNLLAQDTVFGRLRYGGYSTFRKVVDLMGLAQSA